MAINPEALDAEINSYLLGKIEDPTIAAEAMADSIISRINNKPINDPLGAFLQGAAQGASANILQEDPRLTQSNPILSSLGNLTGALGGGVVSGVLGS